MALIKCKECGNKISSKAEICPTCGMRLKAKSGPGCIVGLFKLVGGLIGAGIALVVVTPLLSNKNSVSPERKLEISCEEISKAIPEGTERDNAYTSCIAGGSSAIRAQRRINAEGSQAEGKDVSTAPVVVPSPPPTVPVTEAPTNIEPPQPTQTPATVSTMEPPQNPPEIADPVNTPISQSDKDN